MSGTKRSGGRPTPTKILKLRGSWRAKNRTNEPEPEIEKPVPPEYLNEQEKKIFEEQAETLYALGMITRIDASVLARYAALTLQWREAHRQLVEGVATHMALKDENQKVKHFMPTPPYQVFNKAHEALLKIEQEFGLTPAARPRIQVNKKSDPIDSLLEGLA